MVISPGFWTGKRVLVTGHTGFKGGWLCLWLRQLGATVIGLSLPAPTEPSLFKVARVAEGITSVIGDIRDLPNLSVAIERYRPEIVIHMAAQALVQASYRDPVDTFSTNVLGTVHVLEAARRSTGVRAVVVVTSDKCYENRECSRGYREDDPMGGHDPYSSSKGCAELVVAAYRRSYGGAPGAAAIASARSGNVIGGGDWADDRLIPDMVRAFMSGRPVAIRNPLARRPWQHVLEPLAGYLLLVQRLWERPTEFAEAWNFGPDDLDNARVSDIATRVAARWGDGARWEQDATSYPHEAHTLSLDCTKSHERLPWRSRLSLEVAIEWTVDWYRAMLRGEDMRRLSDAQIARYQGGAIA